MHVGSPWLLALAVGPGWPYGGPYGGERGTGGTGGTGRRVYVVVS